MRRLLLTTIPLLLAGCATAATGPRAGTYAGHYSNGFEVDAFRACGETSSWWVTDAPELRRRYAEMRVKPYEPVYVVIRGEVGPEGKFGHMGVYTREIAVSEVVEMRAERQGDCT